ncbi:hypothetical protein Q0V21_18985 [Paenibacillus sp. 11B]|uniref:hypothetical protein n=1 Tax=Paenibacillus sp. 11B TaxID=3060965 RepID=UPI0026539C53|nr:hypothetical protein [Paenibacillus sp. 11B]MDN8590845.1 hypothetical protein [Paenibacillus sp. 11B]
MKTVQFTYDPLALVRIVLQRYVEETIQGKYYKAKQFACYEYLAKLSDEVLNGLLAEYVKRHELEAITLSDWKKDGEFIFEIIFETAEYRNLEIHFKKRGFGLTGLGVFDRLKNTFHDCGFASHWPTIQSIVEQDYPQYHMALNKMYIYQKLQEYDGVSRTKLEEFIMSNFELCGGTKLITEYI